MAKNYITKLIGSFYSDMHVAIFILIGLLMPAQFAQASDFEREKRLADQNQELVFDGEVIYLESAGHEFMNVFMEAEGEDEKGAAIILHGRGAHPNWKYVARPLRIGLARRGWNTLSMQMPVLEKSAKYYDYVKIMPEAFPRIEAGIDYLKNQGYKKIVLIAHSCSTSMVMEWLEAKRFRDLDAYVGISMGASDSRQPMVKNIPLEKLSVPVLDIYGENEFSSATRSVSQRLDSILRAGNEKSEQIVVLGAGHSFIGKDDVLLELVSEWMKGL